MGKVLAQHPKTDFWVEGQPHLLHWIDVEDTDRDPPQLTQMSITVGRGDKDAIVRQGQQTLVYTVREGKAAPIPVQTSSSDGPMVAIKAEGLSEGMQVVIRGNERIFPGSPVMVAGETLPGATE